MTPALANRGRVVARRFSGDRDAPMCSQPELAHHTQIISHSPMFDVLAVPVPEANEMHMSLSHRAVGGMPSCCPEKHRMLDWASTSLE